MYPFLSIYLKHCIVVIKPENNSLFLFLQSTLWGQIVLPGKQEVDKMECQSILEKKKKKKLFWD